MIDESVILIRLKNKILEKSISSPVEQIISKKFKTIQHTYEEFIVVNGANFDHVINFEIHKKLTCLEISHANFLKFSEHFEVIIS